MNVSVIIPTYNAESYLSALLPALKNQTLNFELIIIDSTSTDNTLTLVKPYAHKIISIPKNKFDHGGTRTQATIEASGDILIFLTQDTLPIKKNTLEVLVNCFNNPEVVGAYGRQIAYKNTNLFGTHLRIFNYPKKSYIRSIKDKSKNGMKTPFLSDSFSAYRKSTMKEVNYFKDGLIVGEDVHIGAKLLLKGHSIAYVSEAQVTHSHSYSPIQEFQRYFDIGVFHTKESWILDTFGKVEGEGLKYIKSEFSYLLKQYAYFRIPEFFIRNGLKYLGYKLGNKYRSLPKKLIKQISMHNTWWDNHA
jgi:rhamnosyltransferase